MMPKKVKKRRQLETDDGVSAGWEEYFDYIFPDDQGEVTNNFSSISSFCSSWTRFWLFFNSFKF